MAEFAIGSRSMRRRGDTCAWYSYLTAKPFITRFSSALHTMKIKHFQDTDTLYIELQPREVAETRDLDEDTLLDLDAAGRVCAITIEHASTRAEIPTFS